jgi:hypothetical protein
MARRSPYKVMKRGGYRPTKDAPPKMKLPKGASPTVPVPSNSNGDKAGGRKK